VGRCSFQDAGSNDARVEGAVRDLGIGIVGKATTVVVAISCLMLPACGSGDRPDIAQVRQEFEQGKGDDLKVAAYGSSTAQPVEERTITVRRY
jgi:hypothetical protein